MTEKTQAEPATPLTAEMEKAIGEYIGAYLDRHLPELVAAATPETPEQARAREDAEAAEARRKADADRAGEDRRRQRAEEKARAVHAEKMAKAQAEAAHAFATASPFSGHTADLKPAILKELKLDDGGSYAVGGVMAFNPETDIEIRDDRTALLRPEYIVGGDIGGSFNLCGISLITDAGTLRCELASPLLIGTGRLAKLPAGSIVFRAQPVTAPDNDAA